MKEKRRPAARSPKVSAPQRPLTIVGLGASAGGLEALELFLRGVPKDCPLAFVVVQHLDPTHHGLLAELLQRHTELRVVEVRDRMKLQAGGVFVIPPNKDLSLFHGTLHLLEPTTPRGLRLPIDFFFRALALDQHERAIGVILSGMGSDGTLGLRAIKESGGAVFVQHPGEAKCSSMPRSAMDMGLADVVAPAEELAGKILAYLRHLPARVRPEFELLAQEQSALEKVVILLRAQTGHDFSLYKKSTLYRRIERRMGLHQLTKIADYVRYLRENLQEAELLFKELLIGVTSFFRDAAVWEQLRREVIPALLAARPHGGVLRAWVAGCSTGEEAYSLAMIFREALDDVRPVKSYSLQIFATDLDQDAIEKARAGVFPPNIAADVSEERLRRFFVTDERGYQVTKTIREMVIFAPQNLVMDPPFTKLEILTCRNVLIYFDTSLQRKLLPLFHYSLNPGGFLVLGNSETIGTATDFFAPLTGKTRLYRRLDRAVRADVIDFPATFTRSQPGEAGAAVPEATRAPAAPNLQALVEQLLLRTYAPAAVLVTDKGDILYISGKTGKFLEPAAGKANWNLLAMARDGVGTALTEAFHQALRKKARVTVREVRAGEEAGDPVVDLTVQPLAEPDALRGMVLVVFAEATPRPPARGRGAARPTPADKARLETLALALRHSREEVQALNEEAQTSQEELKATNEELQSTNEELQSTNEELTTSKEEMQSMNEELQTVNQELQGKLDELSQASNDMKNVLNSAGIAMLFLDNALHVRRFTTQAMSIIRLIPGDTGRPLSHIVTDLDYPALTDDAHEVLRTLVFIEKQVTAHDGRWFTVRIMPYRTQDNRIDGLVITFYDISTTKRLEAELRAAQAALQVRCADQATALSRANGGPTPEPSTPARPTAHDEERNP